MWQLQEAHMQKIFIVSSLALMLAGTLVGQQPRYVTVIAENANLRGTPSTSGKVLDVVEEGERFRLIETRGAWYLVETPEYVGWLHGNTIKLGTRSAQSSSSPSRNKAATPVSQAELRQAGTFVDNVLGKSPVTPKRSVEVPSIPLVETRRPDSGTVMVTGSSRTGLGYLTISNGTDTDAIAKLIDIRAGVSYREVYVQAGSAATIRGIAVGKYSLLFSLGRNYAPSLNKFLTNASYSKFDSQIDFSETKEDLGDRIQTNYDSYRLTLNKVVGGNAATSPISEAEFTKY